jgi:uncharacterized RDD family membrane protein YckC
MATQAATPDTTTHRPVADVPAKAFVPDDWSARRFGLPAPYWRRILARMLDALTVFWLLFALVVTGLAFWVQPLAEQLDPGPWHRAFVSTLTYAGLFVLYEVVFLAARGQTPGKDVMKIKVIRVRDGERPTIGDACTRSVVHATVAVVPNVWVASVAQFVIGLTAPASPMRRTLADLAAGTQVVYYDDPDERPRPSVWDRHTLRIGGHLIRR